jgi:FtsZ-interacting cell division protein ZipA
MEWNIIIPLGIAVVALLIFLNWQNKKDKKGLINKLNQDYSKSKDEEGDIETEEIHH